MSTDPLHIVCPHCHTTNRASAADRANAPDCGKCHQPLFTGHPVALDDEAAFDKHITRSQVPVLVDFWAPWCGPCRAMAPAFEQAAQNLAARYNIRSIPTLALFVNGREVARQPGAMGLADILRWTRSQLR